ncbi:MAG: heat-inducible transcriptional repressor HrcA [bacterium]
MAISDELTPRERRVLEAVIKSYVQTAEPAGSRMLSRGFGLGVSPATIRNTMSDLEEKGFLKHPHTSAGRVPTDKAYRAYVDALLNAPRTIVVAEHDRLHADISASNSTIETILRRAAQSLGVLTQELGVALGPRLDASVLRSLELVRVGGDRLLLVLTLDGGVVRTVFVEVRGTVADNAVSEVTRVLNERLTGHTLRELRASVGDRLRDSATMPDAEELLNIFVQEGEHLLDAALPLSEGSVIVGQASVLASQPEFDGAANLRKLLTLTEEPARLADALRRAHAGDERPGVQITIGGEHGDANLDQFTVVTAEYHAGKLAGIIGVIGPTRMPYDKVISLVQHTSRLLSDLL